MTSSIENSCSVICTQTHLVAQQSMRQRFITVSTHMYTPRKVHVFTHSYISLSHPRRTLHAVPPTIFLPHHLKMQKEILNYSVYRCGGHTPYT